jgi:hypothetical protein
MYDRPNTQELLDAARLHLEQNIIPAVKTDARLYFQTLVAINVLKIVGRELAFAPRHAAAEWASLNALEAVDTAPPADLASLQNALYERNQQLGTAIRAGDYDAGEKQLILFEHVKAVTIAQLEVANPKFLQTLRQEVEAKKQG